MPQQISSTVGMAVHGLFGRSGAMYEVQANLGLDDATGLHVVDPTFLGGQKFDWDMSGGYENIPVLTY